MGLNRHEPNAAHHAFMADMGFTLDRYASMPALERLALVAQLAGQLIAECPPQYSPAELLHVVAQNLAQGNAGRTALAVNGG